MPRPSTTTTASAPPPIRLYQGGAWLLAAAVSLTAIVAWGHDFSWQFTSLNAYQLFPLLGLLAFSLMWTHYVLGSLRQLAGLDRTVLARYFNTTSLAVLVLICLHPGLLIYQRFRDGYGLPPHSYETYVAHGLGWITILGTVSLLIFLSFEFRRLYGGRTWWRYVLLANDAAMLAIFYHALRLGTQLHGWFRTVWWFYGLTLVVSLVYRYSNHLATGRTT